VSEPPHSPWTVLPLGGGRYLVSDGSRRRLAFGARRNGVTWVFLDGVVHAVEAPGTRSRSRRPDHDSALAAPMPATVLRVDIEPGQTVGRGDVLVVLEAMKMELPLKAPRDATVKAIRCRPGELVQPGVPLVELE
jgi:3-methylcrotonyl-CoA carboxylase alpha subunit